MRKNNQILNLTIQRLSKEQIKKNAQTLEERRRIKSVYPLISEFLTDPDDYRNCFLIFDF